MSASTPIPALDARTGRDWLKIAAEYAKPSRLRSSWQLLSNLAIHAGVWWAMIAAFEVSYLLALCLAPVGTAMLTRLFIIQHDCGHGSFFRSRRVNDWVGRFISAITIIPYDFWKRNHAMHHATSGNLSKRGTGDINTITVREYLERSPGAQKRYRIYRHPLFLLFVASNLYFLVKLRSPWGQPETFKKAAPSIIATNLMMAAWMIPLAMTVGWGRFLLVFLPMQLLANTAGLWLFYIQHQYEHAHWDWDESWDFHEASLRGSSHYDLPVLLRWATGNIGAHHVHHLCSKVPNYRLYECLRDHDELVDMNRLTFWKSLPCARLALWDEDDRCLISFRQLDEKLAKAA